MKEKNVVFTLDDFKTKIIPLIEEGLTVPLTVSGGSMNPYIVGGRDTVMISKASFPLKKGDIAFFERLDGQIVMHRVCKVKKDGYRFVGDAQTVIEGPIVKEQIFGKVNRIIRKGKIEEKGKFTWFFFRHVWIRMIPLRPAMMKLYSKLKKK
ncbi:MAG: S24/S26 family peptidase [Clostridia bacterium]|nr:S24/S26 family peptidase [Clostridia bacterium]